MRKNRFFFFLTHVFFNAFGLISLSDAVFIFVVLPIGRCILCKAKAYLGDAAYENLRGQWPLIDT